MKAFFGTCSLLVISICLAPLLLAEEPHLLREAQITEVVNRVEVVDPETLVGAAAEEGSQLSAPELLETGRRSRAELTAGDGTITRVGASTVFSFPGEGRDVKLDQGSLLFHSPSGRGGGRVITNGAVASVVGTTLMIVTTSDGGFKVIVLEGAASVDIENGRRVELAPGQMVFVLPPSEPGVFRRLLRRSSASAELGPIVDIDLERLIGVSQLVRGFQRPLPSSSLNQIFQAMEQQQAGIETGRFQRTNVLIVGATDRDLLFTVDADKLMRNSERERRRRDTDERDEEDKPGKDPEPSDPEPSDPEPSDPEPSDPEPSDPEPSDPEPTMLATIEGDPFILNESHRFETNPKLFVEGETLVGEGVLFQTDASELDFVSLAFPENPELSAFESALSLGERIEFLSDAGAMAVFAFEALRIEEQFGLDTSNGPRSLVLVTRGGDIAFAENLYFGLYQPPSLAFIADGGGIVFEAQSNLIDFSYASFEIPSQEAVTFNPDWSPSKLLLHARGTDGEGIQMNRATIAFEEVQLLSDANITIDRGRLEAGNFDLHAAGDAAILGSLEVYDSATIFAGGTLTLESDTLNFLGGPEDTVALRGDEIVILPNRFFSASLGLWLEDFGGESMLEAGAGGIRAEGDSEFDPPPGIHGAGRVISGGDIYLGDSRITDRLEAEGTISIIGNLSGAEGLSVSSDSLFVDGLLQAGFVETGTLSVESASIGYLSASAAGGDIFLNFFGNTLVGSGIKGMTEGYRNTVRTIRADAVPFGEGAPDGGSILMSKSAGPNGQDLGSPDLDFIGASVTARGAISHAVGRGGSIEFSTNGKIALMDSILDVGLVEDTFEPFGEGGFVYEPGASGHGRIRLHSEHSGYEEAGIRMIDTVLLAGASGLDSDPPDDFELAGFIGLAAGSPNGGGEEDFPLVPVAPDAIDLQTTDSSIEINWSKLLADHGLIGIRAGGEGELRLQSVDLAARAIELAGAFVSVRNSRVEGVQIMAQASDGYGYGELDVINSTLGSFDTRSMALQAGTIILENTTLQSDGTPGSIQLNPGMGGLHISAERDIRTGMVNYIGDVSYQSPIHSLQPAVDVTFVETFQGGEGRGDTSLPIHVNSNLDFQQPSL